MKKFTLQGLIKIATYPHRTYDTRIMFYNEKGEQLVLCVDEEGQCCEDFEFDYNEYEENEIVSTNGITMTITDDDEFECDCGGAIDIEIKGTDKHYKWRVSNDHNGWYCHEVELANETGEYIWSECL